MFRLSCHGSVPERMRGQVRRRLEPDQPASLKAFYDFQLYYIPPFQSRAGGSTSTGRFCIRAVEISAARRRHGLPATRRIGHHEPFVLKF